MHAKPTEENAGREKEVNALSGMCAELHLALYHIIYSAVNATEILHFPPPNRIHTSNIRLIEQDLFSYITFSRIHSFCFRRRQKNM